MDSATVTSTENSTQNLSRKTNRKQDRVLREYSSEYSGLRLGSVHPITIEDAIDVEPVESTENGLRNGVISRIANPGSTAPKALPASFASIQSVQSEPELGSTQNSSVEAAESNEVLPPPSEASMQDFYQLQQNLLGLTVAFGAGIFFCVWGVYSLQIALDYLLGTVAGVVYLKMLGENVSGIGRQSKNSSAGRLAIFVGVMIVALRWDQVEVIPVFLGFLTYKVAIIAYALWPILKPQPVSAQALEDQLVEVQAAEMQSPHPQDNAV